jgi:hypothetical protein
MVRNNLNIVNSKINTESLKSKKITKVKKLILNSRVQYGKNIKFFLNKKILNKNNLNGIFKNQIITPTINNLLKNTISIDQLKKLIKWEIA